MFGLFYLLSFLLIVFQLPEGLSDLHAGLLGKALLALDRGRLEVAGFVYPPLPLLLLLPYPYPETPSLLAALALAGVGLLFLQEALKRGEGGILLVPLVLFLTPWAAFLAQTDFAGALGLLLLTLIWQTYRAYIQDGLSRQALLIGLGLGAATYVTPLALPFGLGLALHLGLFRPLSPVAWLSSGLLLLLPSLLAFGSWAYITWLFTGEITFFYREVSLAQGLNQSFLLSVPYLILGLLLPGRPPSQRTGYLFPLTLVPLQALMGIPVPRVDYLILAYFIALTALSENLKPLQRSIVVVSTLIKGIAAWLLLSIPAFTNPFEHGLAAALATAPPRTVLTDDRSTYRLVALAKTARPFLLPADANYPLALASPQGFAAYVLLCPGDDPLWRAYGERPPPGFLAEVILAEGCRLYRRVGESPLLP